MIYKKLLALTALFSALLATALAANAAYAHVGVTPATVPPNSSQTFTLRVPTEKDVPTVQLRVEFPSALTVSRFQPKPGWTREVERDTQQRIIAATWSGGKIAPGEYDEFTFVARTPSEPGKLMLKAWQGYEGGETVAWVNAEDPNSAPAFEVAAPSEGTTITGSEEHTGTNGGLAVSADAAQTSAASSSQAMFVSLLALAVAAVGAILALVALLQRPGPSAS